MDSKDAKIIELLKANSKLTTSQIAKKTGLPITTVHNRIKRMEHEGLIKGYSLVLDYKKLGKPITSYIFVNINYSLPSGGKIRQEDVALNIRKIGAEEVSILTGGVDLLLKIRVRDIDELNDFVINRLRSIDGVDKTQTMIVLSTR